MISRVAQHRAGEAGFTMVELMVVLLVLGVLAAIAIPTFIVQKDKASDTAAKTSASTAARAMAIYEQDNDTYACGDTAACRAALRSIDPAAGDAGLSYSASGGSSADPTKNGYRVTAGGAQLRTFWVDRAPGNAPAEHGCDLNGASTNGGCRVHPPASSGSW